MNIIWVVFHLGVLINVSHCLRKPRESKVYITPYSQFVYYKEDETLFFLCLSSSFQKFHSRWLFLDSEENFDEAIETEGYWVHLNLQASHNGSRLLCYHLTESGPPYVNYSEVITFINDERSPPAKLSRVQRSGTQEGSGESARTSGLVAVGGIVGCTITTSLAVIIVWLRYHRKSKEASSIPQSETSHNLTNDALREHNNEIPVLPVNLIKDLMASNKKISSAPMMPAAPAQVSSGHSAIEETHYGYSYAFGIRPKICY